jgi:hypothetical protein
MAILQIKHRCPHCRELCDFDVWQLSELREVPAPKDRKPPLWDAKADHFSSNERLPATRLAQGCALSRCPRCINPVMFVVSVPAGHLGVLAGEMQRNRDGEFKWRFTDNMIVHATYPEAKTYDAHPAWPQEIQKQIVEAQQILDEGKTPGIAVMMLASVLEVASAHLGATVKNLSKRIDALAERGLLVGSLKDWAHSLRLDRNDMAHELKSTTAQEAREYLAFVMVFLQVAFELPQAIEDKRARSSHLTPPSG